MWTSIDALPTEPGHLYLAMVEIAPNQALPDLLRVDDEPNIEGLKAAGYTYFWSEPLDPDVMDKNPYIEET